MASAGSDVPSDSNAGQSRYRQRTVTTTHFFILGCIKSIALHSHSPCATTLISILSCEMTHLY